MDILIISLIGCILILFLFIIKLLLELKRVNEQTIIKIESDSNFVITNDLKLNVLNTLCENLNVMYEKSHHAHIEEKRKENEFKEMLSYIAHDVRTPLTSIQGYLQILKETDIIDDDDASYKIIYQRFYDIRNLLEQFFIYSKLLNHDYRLQVEKCNLYNIFCDSLASFYQAFLDKEVEPCIDFSQQDIMVDINLDLIKRVFDNLLVNALIHGNGNIIIKQNENKLLFSNTFKEGIHIDKNKVFERFYKADISRTNISSGLGLSIVKEIVELFGWIIDVDIKENLFIIIITMKIT